MTWIDWITLLSLLLTAGYFALRIKLWPVLQEDRDWERLMMDMERRTDRRYYGEYTREN